MRRGVEAAVVAGLLAAFVGLSVAGLRWRSATFDETAHLPAGYSYWRTGDFRLNPEHPPLLKLLAAAPLLFTPVRWEAGDPAWAERRQWELGRRFLFEWNDGPRLIDRGRLPIILLAAGLGLAVFFETRRHSGPPAAAAALVLCAFSPELLAHGSLVTTDAGAAFFVFVTVAAFRWAWSRPTAGPTLVVGLTLGAALASKFSALLLVPMLGVLAAWLALARGSGQTRGARLRRAAIVLGAAGAVAFAVLWAAYGFRPSISQDPAVVQAFDWEGVARRSGMVGAAARRAREWGVLPEAYLFGLQRFRGASENRRSFVLGEVSEEGFWYYFPLTFAVKTPLPLLLLLLVHLAWRGARWDRATAVWIWVPAAVYAAFVLSSRLHIGHRHLLPLYPFLFVAGGQTAARLLARGGAARAAAAALLAWYAVGTLRVHPHELAYFNELAGGPAGGHRVLSDSNLDWGQDLPSLAVWLRSNGRPPVRLSYFGTAEPSAYGVDAALLPGYIRGRDAPTSVQRGELVAISATNLVGLYLDPADPFLARLRGKTPVGRAGYSIFLYRADRDDEMSRTADPAP